MHSTTQLWTQNAVVWLTTRGQLWATPIGFQTTGPWLESNGRITPVPREQTPSHPNPPDMAFIPHPRGGYSGGGGGSPPSPPPLPPR